jgi:uncharacterized protein (TIGR03083 family)
MNDRLGCDDVNVSSYVAQLRNDGDRVSTVLAGADLDARVPSCPDWSLRDLIRHLGGVHRWATGFVFALDDHPKDTDLEELIGGWPADADLGPWFAAGHRALVQAIEEAPADLETWTFLEAPTPLMFWARRQAHETAIHRVDAELAVGRVTGFPMAFAADGIDELLLRFASRPGRELPVDRPRSMTVRASDAERSWRITFAPDALDIEADVTRNSGGPLADANVEGPASELYVWLWNRRETGGFEVRGDPGLLALWRDVLQVRWS